MKAYDFIYDGKSLSDFGFMICSFDNKSTQTISNGGQIKFNTSATLGGTKFEVTSTEYDECLEATIQICKNTCSGNALEISPREFREITKWLNRKKFLKLKILDDEYIDVFYEAIFNVNRIEIDGTLYGIELLVHTNRPFALKEPVIFNIENTTLNGKHSIYDISQEEGFIYPYMEITIIEDGDLSIHNEIENRETFIANCVAGEVITMDYPVISSTDFTHKIQDDFNWDFFRIANTYYNGRNNLTVSIPCIINIKYSPIIKIGF